MRSLFEHIRHQLSGEASNDGREATTSADSPTSNPENAQNPDLRCTAVRRTQSSAPQSPHRLPRPQTRFLRGSSFETETSDRRWEPKCGRWTVPSTLRRFPLLRPGYIAGHATWDWSSPAGMRRRTATADLQYLCPRTHLRARSETFRNVERPCRTSKSEDSHQLRSPVVRPFQELDILFGLFERGKPQVLGFYNEFLSLWLHRGITEPQPFIHDLLQCTP